MKVKMEEEGKESEHVSNTNVVVNLEVEVAADLDNPCVVPVLPGQARLLPRTSSLLALVDAAYGVRGHPKPVPHKYYNILCLAFVPTDWFDVLL